MESPSVVHVAVELRVKDQLHKAFVRGVRPKAVHVVHGQVQPVQRPRPLPIAPVVSAGSWLHRDDRDEAGLNLASVILDNKWTKTTIKGNFTTLGQPRASNKSSQCFPAFFLNPIRLAQEADAAQLTHAWAQHRILAASIAPPCKHLHFIGRRCHGWWHQRYLCPASNVQSLEFGVRRRSNGWVREELENWTLNYFYVSHLNCVFKEFMSMSEKNPVCRDWWRGSNVSSNSNGSPEKIPVKVTDF